MKKSDLKKVLKPIIAECIKESLYEEGLLKDIVSQVVEGYSAGATPIVETQAVTNAANKKEINESKKMREKLDQTKKQMLSAIGNGAYGGVDVFAGTTPMRSAEPQPGNILEGVEPGDPGVDISSILNSNWGKLI